MKEQFDYSYLTDLVNNKYRGKDFLDKSAVMCKNANVKIFSLRQAMKDNYYFNAQELLRMKQELDLSDQEFVKTFFTNK